MNQLQPFRPHFGSQTYNTGQVAAGVVETCDKSVLDRIRAKPEYDRNCCGRCLGRWCGSGVGKDQRYLAANQIGCKHGKAFVMILCPAVFDRYVLTFDETSFFQTLLE